MIVFRGRCGNGKWEFGDLITKTPGSPLIMNEQGAWAIDPATVGQYTGLKDKNGVEIYEGDMLHHKWDSGNAIYLETISEVKFSRGAFVVDDKKRADWLLSLHALPKWAEIEVIGNIHDNPDLLGVTE